jgi:hypothetical protein
VDLLAAVGEWFAGEVAAARVADRTTRLEPASSAAVLGSTGLQPARRAPVRTARRTSSWPLAAGSGSGRCIGAVRQPSAPKARVSAMAAKRIAITEAFRDRLETEVSNSRIECDMARLLFGSSFPAAVRVRSPVRWIIAPKPPTRRS